jgi:flagellar hook-associated protein 2
VAAAQDALFTIDGVSMSRSSNAIDDAVENLHLQLLQETSGSPVTATVNANTSATVQQVQGFVNAYNTVMDFLNQHQSFDTEAETGGLFFGSPAVLQVETQLREQVSDIVNTLGGDLVLGSQVGLSFDTNDKITFDSSELTSALESDPEGVKRLFGTRTQTSGDVEVFGYSSATGDSGAAGWDVEITQAATRPTATGATLASGITVDEDLTVNGHSVTLTAGMSLQDAADELNALFATERMDMSASVESDQLVIQHDLWGDGHALEITSSLDDGAGGTDLGGATSGDLATYEGQDVAGTIDGEDASGTGRLLTGDSGSSVEGLQLVVSATAPGTVGNVQVSRGIAARMTSYIEQVTDEETGALSRAVEGESDEIAAIDEEIAELEADVDRYIEQLQIDFARMETKMSQSMNLLDWMENQVQYLPGAGGDN